MDKFSYKIAMTVEATLLILLMSTFYVTSLIGNGSVFFHLRLFEFFEGQVMGKSREIVHLV
jgi:hypothetical protein